MRVILGLARSHRNENTNVTMQLRDNADADLDRLSAVLRLSFQINHQKITNPFKSRNGILGAAVRCGIGTGIDFFPYETSETYYNLDTQFSYCL